MTRLSLRAWCSARQLVAGLVLVILVPEQTRAQDSPTPSDMGVPVSRAANVGSDSTAPPPSAAGAPYVAPGAIEAAWLELRAIQQREDALWKEQADVNLGPPAVAIAVGAPVFAVMLPIGGMLYSAWNYGGSDAEGRGPAIALLALGVVGFVALVAGTTVLARQRKRRLQGNAEIRALAERRSLLEDLVEADWRAKRTAAAR